ncbi:hypothetical protein ABPG77_010835 [Micractinium sp. CCAP 211/92]
MSKSGIKASANLQARIKRMMQSDEDVGKVAKASPVLIAKALDIFLASIVEGAAAIAESRGAKMLTASHLKAHIQGEVLLDFLRDTVEGVPDLPPAGSEPNKSSRQKRQRSKSLAEESGSPKARSRGTRGRGGRGGRGRGRKGGSADDEEAAAGLVQSPVGQSTAMDVEGTSQQPAATGLAEGGPETASQQEQQHDQQQQQQPGAQPAGGEGPAAAAATGAGQGGPEGGAAAEEVAAPPPVSVPSFLAAAAAVPGAEAEEEDYDE